MYAKSSFFSVKDLTRLESMTRSTILAGAASENIPITKATVIEAENMAEWARSGDIVITTGHLLRNDTELMKRNIKELSGKGIVALCVKPGRYQEIPSEAVVYARSLDFLLIQLPIEAIFSNITRDVAAKVLERNVAAFREEQKQTDALINILLENPDLKQFIPRAEKIIGNRLLIFNDIGELLISDDTRSILPLYVQEELLRDLFQGIESEQFTILYDNTPYSFSRESVHTADSSSFQVLLLKIGSSNVMPDFLPLDRISRVLSLEIKNTSALRRIRRQYEYKFVMDLLRGNLDNGTDICAEAALFGYSFSPRKEYYVSFVNINDPESAFQVGEIFIIQHIIHSFDSNMAVVLRNGAMILLFEKIDGEDYQEKLSQIGHKIQRILKKESMSFCMSPPRPIYEIPKAYAIAERNSAISKTCGIHSPFITSDQLGVLFLLSMIPDNQSSREFSDRFLLPVKEYDIRHKSNLLTTLTVYMETGCSVKNTSEKLFTHYNTVVYRLDKIRSLMNADLNDSEIQFQIRLALKLDVLWGGRARE